MAVTTVRDIGAHTEFNVGTTPTNDDGSAAIEGTGVDTLGKHSGTLYLATGAATGTPTTQTADCKLQDSADNSTFADVSPAIAVTQVAADSGTASVDFDARARRRFVRAVTTVAFTGGTTPAWASGATILMGGHDRLPDGTSL